MRGANPSLVMADPDTSRRNKAIFRWYRILARQRSFLPRNLATILYAHDQKLALLQHDSDLPKRPPQEVRMNRRSSRRNPDIDLDRHRAVADTAPSIPDILERSVHLTPRQYQQPCLRIEKLRILPLDRSLRPGSRRTTRDRNPSTDPDWLPPPDQSFAAKCRIVTRICDAEGSPLQIVPQKGYIKGFKSPKTEFNFEVVLDQPVEFDVANLFLGKEVDDHVNSSNTSNRWKRSPAKKYAIEIAIACVKVEAAAQFFALLTGVSARSLGNKPEKEFQIRTLWSGLPECPKAGELLPIFKSSGEDYAISKHGMFLSMSWNVAPGSVWDICRAAQRREQATHEHQRRQQHQPQPHLLTPDSCEMPANRSCPYTINYYYREPALQKTHIANDLRCVLCLNWRDYNDLPSLLLHYKTCHDHFELRVSNKQISSKGQFSANITFLRPVDPTVPTVIEEPVTTSWVAPDRPFDKKSYVEGDDSWVNGRPRKSTRVRAPTSNTSKRHLPVDEIPNVPAPKRRRFSPMTVPGIAFYHTSSKQQAADDDWFSEEDDQMDDSRLKHSQRQKLLQLGLSERATDFHEAFNRHLDHEVPESHCLLREAVVRFARRYRKELRCPEWNEQFLAKLELLERGDVIDNEVIDYCLHDPDKPKPVQKAHSSQTNSNENKQRPAPRSSITPRNTQASPAISIRRTEVPESPDADRLTSSPMTLSTPTAHSGARARVPRVQMHGAKLTWLEDDEDLSQGSRHRADPSRYVASSSPLDASLRAQTHSDPKLTSQPKFSSPAATTQKQKSVKGKCVCGEVAAMGPGSIGCEGPSCIRMDFHTRCVGLERPVVGWKCSDCLSSGTNGIHRGT